MIDRDWRYSQPVSEHPLRSDVVVSVLQRTALDGVWPVGRPPRPVRPGTAGFPLDRPLPPDRLLSWLLAIMLAFVGGILRFYRLGYPTDDGTPVFDEKHYVPQAWQMLRNGGVEDNPGYELVVHPPLAKQLIALGEAALGYDGVGWRVSAAISGTVCILLIVRIARRMTRSTLLGVVACVLLICDGVSFVQSRMGMLDVFMTLFVVAAFGALVVDRDDVRARMAVVVAEGDGRWNVYAGGYSDMVAQRGEGVTAKPVAKGEARAPREKSEAPASAPKSRLTFRDKHALETLPARIAKLEADIAKLSKTIADPSLYAKDRAAFDKASAALGNAQAELAQAEDDWLRLEELREQVEAR